MAKLAKKPQKPYRSFCLTAHNNGQWCKKIRGKVHFFGVWADPQGALDRYLQVAADLSAGRQPRRSTLSPDGVTVKDVCNHSVMPQLRGQRAPSVSAGNKPTLVRGCAVRSGRSRSRLVPSGCPPVTEALHHSIFETAG
jgi:hypothetical protein